MDAEIKFSMTRSCWIEFSMTQLSQPKQLVALGDHAGVYERIPRPHPATSSAVRRSACPRRSPAESPVECGGLPTAIRSAHRRISSSAVSAETTTFTEHLRSRSDLQEPGVLFPSRAVTARARQFMSIATTSTRLTTLASSRNSVPFVSRWVSSSAALSSPRRTSTKSG